MRNTLYFLIKFYRDQHLACQHQVFFFIRKDFDTYHWLKCTEARQGQGQRNNKQNSGNVLKVSCGILYFAVSYRIAK